MELKTQSYIYRYACMVVWKCRGEAQRQEGMWFVQFQRRTLQGGVRFSDRSNFDLA